MKLERLSGMKLRWRMIDEADGSSLSLLVPNGIVPITNGIFLNTTHSIWLTKSPFLKHRQSHLDKDNLNIDNRSR